MALHSREKAMVPMKAAQKLLLLLPLALSVPLPRAAAQETMPVKVSVTVENTSADTLQVATATFDYTEAGERLSADPVTVGLTVGGTTVRGFAALTRIPDTYTVHPETIVVDGDFIEPKSFLYRSTVVWGGDLPPGGKGTVHFDADAR